MRLLLTVPHFYRPSDGPPRHGSHAADADARLRSLTTCLATLRQTFAPGACVIDIERRTTVPAGGTGVARLDVVVCTTGGDHLVPRLNLPPGWYSHHATDAEPTLLGYECHAILRERLGDYDVYGFLEDDLLIDDSLFFAKQAWFRAQAGDECVLQPNRFEAGVGTFAHKAYIDGDIRDGATSPFQDRAVAPVLHAQVMGAAVRFVRPKNPHSGCFFLSARQMAVWAGKPWFLDRSSSFVGPLESAATLGLMRTFRVYKPAPECAAFLEVRHAGTAFLGLIRPPQASPRPET